MRDVLKYSKILLNQKNRTPKVLDINKISIQASEHLLEFHRVTSTEIHTSHHGDDKFVHCRFRNTSHWPKSQ